MESIRIGLVADPSAPTEMARGMTDLGPADGSDAWDITVVSEPFTTGSEDVEPRSVGCRPTRVNEAGTSLSA